MTPLPIEVALTLFVMVWVFVGLAICPQGMYEYFRERTEDRDLSSFCYGLGVLIIWPYFWWKWNKES